MVFLWFIKKENQNQNEPFSTGSFGFQKKINEKHLNSQIHKTAETEFIALFNFKLSEDLNLDDHIIVRNKIKN